eukprot:5215325-Pleurochrysis_carterae.AAC.2
MVACWNLLLRAHLPAREEIERTGSDGLKERRDEGVSSRGNSSMTVTVLVLVVASVVVFVVVGVASLLL